MRQRRTTSEEDSNKKKTGENEDKMKKQKIKNVAKSTASKKAICSDPEEVEPNSKVAKAETSEEKGLLRRLYNLVFAKEVFDDEESVYSPSNSSNFSDGSFISNFPTSPSTYSETSEKSEGEGTGNDPSASASTAGKRKKSVHFPRTMHHHHHYSSNDNEGVTSLDRKVVRFIDKFLGFLPFNIRKSLFDSYSFGKEFFLKKRVYFIMIIMFVLFFFFAGNNMASLMTDFAGSFVVYEENRPGFYFLDKYNQGNLTLPYKHPVIFIPGFITGALELWEAHNLSCLQNQFFFGENNTNTFRQRMFGPKMIFLILTDPTCWLELFSLNITTGMDRDHIKVRADSGFSSVEYFVPGYWVWAKILINLADIGYDPQSMAVMTYDWRLSPKQTHERDGYFYHIRNSIKFFCQKNRRQSIVVSHSYGTTVAIKFFQWIGRREPEFLDHFVGYWVNIGGVGSGLPKALVAMLIGDVRDTMVVPSVAKRVFDNFITPSSRYNLTRSWSCLMSMLPKGCDDFFPDLLVYEGVAGEDEQEKEQEEKKGSNSKSANGNQSNKEEEDSLGKKRLHTQFTKGQRINNEEAAKLVQEACRKTGHENCVKVIEEFLSEHEHDQLPVLPQAPNMTVVCLYGVNKPVEVGYHIQEQINPEWHDGTSQNDLHNRIWTTKDSISGGYENVQEVLQRNAPPRQTARKRSDQQNDTEDKDNGDEHLEERKEFIVNFANHSVVQGVRLGNGDGTVPLASAGYMCRAPNGWKQNVGRVVTIEYNHRLNLSNINLRGGFRSGDHVDVLGNFDLIETVLKIASGFDRVAFKQKKEKEKKEGKENTDEDKSHEKKFIEYYNKFTNEVEYISPMLEDRIYSDIDELIHNSSLKRCLAKKNIPIVPIPDWRADDDNEFY